MIELRSKLAGNRVEADSVLFNMIKDCRWLAELVSSSPGLEEGSGRPVPPPRSLAPNLGGRPRDSSGGREPGGLAALPCLLPF